MSIADRLRKHIASISPEQFRREWVEIEQEQAGVSSPACDEFIQHLNSIQKSTCPFKCGMITISDCSHCGKSYENGISTNQK